MRSIWQIYAFLLEQWGIDSIFGMVGEGNGLLEAATLLGKIKVIPVRDQRVGFAVATGYAQAKGGCAVYVASSGPAIASAAMGILEAYSSQTPLVIIGNGVSRQKKGTGAFQEFDSIGFMQPITKWSYRVEAAEKLVWSLKRAFHLALNGKKGPVYLEIPDDLVEETPSFSSNSFEIKELRSSPDPISLERAFSKFIKAKRPLMIAGGGCISSGAKKEFLASVLKWGAAAFTTAAGRGAISEDHSQYGGMLGLYLTSPGHLLLKEADLIFVVGSQLEETALIGVKEILEEKEVIQLDKDSEVIGKSLPISLGLIGDAQLGLQTILQKMEQGDLLSGKGDWLDRIKEVRKKQYDNWVKPISFQEHPIRCLYSHLQRIYGTHQVIVLENGMQDMWGYFSPVYRLNWPGESFVPGEQTGLGLSMGLSVGVKLARPDVPVLCVIGDGGFQFGHPILYTASSLRIGISFFVIDNGGFGWPQLAQSKEGVKVGCRFDRCQDLKRIANEIGAFYSDPETEEELKGALEKSYVANLNQQISIVKIKVDPFQDIPSHA